jgi:hypothetical protein
MRNMQGYFEKERSDLNLAFAKRIDHVSDRVVRDSLKTIDPDRPSLTDKLKEHNAKRLQNAGISTLGDQREPKRQNMRLRDQMNAINTRSNYTLNSVAANQQELTGQSNSSSHKKKPILKSEYVDPMVEQSKAKKIDTSNYKYPTNINFKALDWLFSDDD